MFKVYPLFIDHLLKKKLKYAFVGFSGMILDSIMAALYNTWSNPIFQLFWIPIAIILVITSGILLYYGFGRGL